MSIIARFFPNGEFTQGVSSTKRRDKRTHPLEGYTKSYDDHGEVSLRWERRDAEVRERSISAFIGNAYISNSTQRQYTCVAMNAKMQPSMQWQDDAGKTYITEYSVPIGVLLKRGELSPLGSSDSPILEKTAESRKKLLSMTRKMARNIRNYTYILERDNGKDVLSFLTLTLPSLPIQDMNTICQQWGRLTNEILKWLQYNVEKRNIEFQYVYCSEIQEQRLEKLHEYAPHLHIVFRGRSGKKAPWAITPKQVRKAWLRLLSRCVSYSVKSDSCENLQRIKYSAARYLSKYISKGCNKNVSSDTGDATPRLHTQWGGSSRSLSTTCKRETKVIGGTGETQQLAVSLLRCLPHGVKRGVLRFWHQSYIPIGASDSEGHQRYLKVSVGCLAFPLSEGGLERLIKYCYELSNEQDCEEKLILLDSFSHN